MRTLTTYTTRQYSMPIYHFIGKLVYIICSMFTKKLSIFSSILSAFLLYECQGLKDAKNAMRIVGGDSLTIYDVPFIVSFRHDDSHICGASIVNKIWAVTAAHCIFKYGNIPKEYTVRSGSSYRASGGTLHQVTKIITHENFNETILDWDIAVISVDPPFEFDNTTQPAKLPEKNIKYKDNWATVVGFGAETSQNDKILSPVLKYTTLPKVKQEDCIENYKDSYIVTERESCYGFQSGIEDSCKGDSGGPMVNKEFVLICIVSWGDECATENSPGVCLIVQMFRDWIDENTKID